MSDKNIERIIKPVIDQWSKIESSEPCAWYEKRVGDIDEYEVYTGCDKVSTIAVKEVVFLGFNRCPWCGRPLDLSFFGEGLKK